MKIPFILAALVIIPALMACSEPTQTAPALTPVTERSDPGRGSYLGNSEANMVLKWPTANVLNPIRWLGCHQGETRVPARSGVIIQLEKAEYLVTALHVTASCGMNPLVRFNNEWNAITWEIVATSEADDIAVLRTDAVLDGSKIPVRHGKVAGEIYGQIGYALGYPGVYGERGLETNHVAVVGGRTVPIAALAISNFASTEKGAYSSSYINAGFSGGAIVFPVATEDWTIAGIITHFPVVPRPVYHAGNDTGDYLMQHTGLVGFTPLERVEVKGVRN